MSIAEIYYLAMQYRHHSLRTLITRPAIRAFLLSAVVYLATFTYCSYAFWRDPHSAFFKSDHVYDLKYSALRQADGLELVNAANGSEEATNIVKAGESPALCAVFMTVKRGKKEYLTESLGSMLHGLTLEERENLYLSVLFLDTEPSAHPYWDQAWVRRLADSATGYNNLTEDQFREIRDAEKARNFYVKGVLFVSFPFTTEKNQLLTHSFSDYVYALQQCMSTSAPFISIFEDDIVFAEGWMTRTLLALATLKFENPGSWLYLRLFYTETSATMWNDTDFWYANMWLTIFLAVLLGFFLLLQVRRYWPPSRLYLDNSTVAILSFVTIPVFVILIFMVGKFNLFPPAHGPFLMNENGCCTQAMVFPRQEVPGLIDYFHQRHDGQSDSLIEEYCERNKKDRFALVPYVVQHVGLISSRDNTFVNAQSTWAFWFENFDSGELRRWHTKNVRKIPWVRLKGD